MPDQPASTRSPYQLDTAELLWKADNVPEADKYGDIYFSTQHGLDETRYVFLQHNQLQQRWQQLADGQQFHIGETGFGTGLNFLAAWQLWRQTAPLSAHLHFISVEKHPLRKQDLQRALTSWPELQDLADQLITTYPVLTPGHHLLPFDGGRVTLHLLLGEAIDGFEQLRRSNHPRWQTSTPHPIDAWFLDGFAPAKNPDLWHDKLYALLADLSGDGTTLATFTAVGDVRRGLIAHGFNMSKTKGFGMKRDMLVGQFDSQNRKPAPPPPRSSGTTAPWYFSPSKHITGKHIAIIGGGLAGTTSAYAMAQRGWRVSLIERSDQLAQGASGNPQGMLYTKLSHQTSTLNQFALSSYLYALRFYRYWQQQAANPAALLDLCGVLQLATSSNEQNKLTPLNHAFAHHPELMQCVSAEQASALAGIPLDFPGCFFPQAGWVAPRVLCNTLAAHPQIEVISQQQIHSLEVQNLSSDQTQWQLNDSNGKALLRADAVIIANSRDAIQFQQSCELPVKTIRGQITLLAASASSQTLKTVICHEGYITPAINGLHNLGATFDNGDSRIDIRQQDHLRNLQSLARSIPSLDISPTDNQSLDGRAALRCTSPDYLPMVGPVHQHALFLKHYAKLKKDAKTRLDQPGSYHPNLYINIGHGSRGLTSTPLCSELLAAMICGEPLPIPRTLVSALNPARFVIRDLIRNKH
ncbi:MAG: bifunctional tRNA (5-methylaminomethyl-2-thiouridine)(34)-methyltransferase MnmD/FAD-dependent 5-carboxymethylaminomethyl-2-thiouridine(34) oxidoreductase MnmC [Spongiibacteraceae bacterium]